MHHASSASAPFLAQWPSAVLHPVCQYLSCSVGFKIWHSSPGVVSQVPSRGKQSPSIYWLCCCCSMWWAFLTTMAHCCLISPCGPWGPQVLSCRVSCYPAVPSLSWCMGLFHRRCRTLHLSVEFMRFMNLWGSCWPTPPACHSHSERWSCPPVS